MATYHENEDRKKGEDEVYAQVTVEVPDEREPHLIPTEEDLRVLRRVPAGMP